VAGNNLFQSDDLHGGSQAPVEQKQQSSGGGVGGALKGFATAMDKVAHNDALQQSEEAKANNSQPQFTNPNSAGSM